ncbi:MAG: alanine-glyoxylate transaminase / serine-glyoxylate transaminase / serine-pyruvate transaminase [bacterium]|nr:MAG: alanine-glyoxylate transaminase / serine-glyoxylate transaminase / serine-pyruvate transaminase [bacterium]KAF0147974.1 MAG: alanine-glyoxylate transaminase / serine-glyoxylate transaminase / serine-pyruvate transaminase [bacterium]KAF0167512.1 MAG: alanine-glyoxylate transaminase / serine-glyoxylate transaminase / serine-pyruvate transaminase [bacterium]TXT17255.1 MAG: alanine-glyoxylate transaminase / serine-glyoxylate transaminase / serine-pyruvate transaminase [bacterium]
MQAPRIASFQPPRRTLMGPGPSDVPQRILDAMARPTIGHLDPAFSDMMEQTKSLLRYAFQTENKLTFPVSGPGSVGMETCFVNLVEPGDQVIVCINGVFGGRMLENVKRSGGVAVVVEDAWGRAVDPDKVETAFAANPDAKLLAFVHAETSTGAQSDAAALSAIARRHGALTLMDCVTSLGGTPVLIDAWGIDAAYSGSQKCLSCTPGLSPVTFSERAIEKVKARKTPVQSWFMDLNLVLGYWSGEGKRTYHHTAPINPLYGLHEALVMLAEEGIENAWTRHRAQHEALKAGLERLGLAFIVPEGERLPQLNSVTFPAGVDDAAARARLLNEFNLEIGAGLGALAGKIWRIGLMGASARRENVEYCLKALAAVLGK